LGLEPPPHLQQVFLEEVAAGARLPGRLALPLVGC